MLRFPQILLAVPVVALLAAGCGSSSNDNKSSGSSPRPPPPPPAPPRPRGRPRAQPAAASTGGGSGSKLSVSADGSGQLKFDKSSLTAKAGKVTIVMDNPSSSGLPHAIGVEGNGVDKDGATASPGSTSTVTVTLKPGTYDFYCPVDGHRAAGMQGKLTVS